MTTTQNIASAPADRFRVVWGWSAYQDFASADQAAALVDSMIDKPCADPLMRSVKVLDLASTTVPYATLVEIDRPAA